jgi:Tol biopolymer transport system component
MLCCALAAAIAGCGQPSAAGPSVPGTDQSPPCIVATERGPRGGQLVFVGADGARRGDLTKATLVAVRDNSARVSPDGKWLVFASTRARSDMTQTSLWLLSTRTGQQPRRLTTSAAIDMQPVWTPDGKSIVYASQVAPGQSFGLWRVSLMSVPGRPPMQAAPPVLVAHDSLASALHPTVSPDGKHIVYMRLTPDKKSALWRVGMDSGKDPPRALTKGPVDLTPTYTPDGKHIAFASRDKGLTTHLYLMRPDGSDRRIVIEEPLAAQTGPRFSPDGRYLFATSVFRSLTTGKALYSAIVFVDMRESTPVLRSLHDVVGREVNRFGPALLPCPLDATVMHRNGLFRDNLRDAFAEEVRRRVDKMREASGGRLPDPEKAP